MFIALVILFSTLVVCAQVLWKYGVENYFTAGFSIQAGIKLLLTTKILAGVILYAFATIIYLLLLSKYPFSKVQILAVPLTLIFSLFAGNILFNDHLSMINIGGVILIILGIILAIISIGS